MCAVSFVCLTTRQAPDLYHTSTDHSNTSLQKRVVMTNDFIFGMSGTYSGPVYFFEFLYMTSVQLVMS